MMVYHKSNSSDGIMIMDMECERKTTFSKGHDRKTAIFVLLGTLCIIIMMILTSVIFFHQQRTFSMLESWMDIHSSNRTSVKPDLQITVGNQEHKQTETQNTLDNLKSAVTSLQSDLQNKQRDFETLSSSMSDLKSSVADLTSSVASLSSQIPVIKQNESLTEVKSLMNSLSSAVSALTAQLNDAEERVMNALKDLKSSMRDKPAADVPVTCKSGWISYKRSCFLFSNLRLDWAAARDYCKAQDMLLLKIQEDDMEWEFLNNNTIPAEFWVGLTDQTTGQWRWVDDTPYTMNKERWNAGQPDNWTKHGLGEEGEDCGQISYTGKLNDNHCSVKMRFICRVQY